MKKIITGLVLVLSVLFGGTLLAAPAQAQMGTTVYLWAATPLHGWVKTTNVNGWEKIIHQNETAQNVNEICPPSSGWEMRITGPNNSIRVTAPGLCYYPTNDGVYQVAVGYANSFPE